jgi:hypothetical protein
MIPTVRTAWETSTPKIPIANPVSKGFDLEVRMSDDCNAQVRYLL